MSDDLVQESLGYWTVGGQGELRQTRIASEGTRVTSLFGAVSPGTERQIARDARGAAPCSYMRTEADAIFYGYSVVGRVGAGGTGTGRVFTMHPHQQSFAVSSAALLDIPEAVPSSRATLIPNLETALNAVWDGGVVCGDRVLVIGGGIVGALTAYLASRIPGTEVFIFDTCTRQCELLNRRSWNVKTCESLESLEAFPRIFNASGHESGLQTAIDKVSAGGRVIDLSWYGERPVSLNLGGHYHFHRVQIKVSQVSTVSDVVNDRFGFAERSQTVLRLLGDPGLDQFISHRVAFEELPSLMKEVYSGKLACLSILIDYGVESV